MYGMLGGFAGYFKVKKSYIDNTTFRLHYRTTFAILVRKALLSWYVKLCYSLTFNSQAPD